MVQSYACNHQHCATELKFYHKVNYGWKVTRDWLMKRYNFIKNFVIEFQKPSMKVRIRTHTPLCGCTKYAGLDFNVVHRVMKNNLHSIIHFHMEYQKKCANRQTRTYLNVHEVRTRTVVGTVCIWCGINNTLFIKSQLIQERLTFVVAGRMYIHSWFSPNNRPHAHEHTHEHTDK